MDGFTNKISEDILLTTIPFSNPYNNAAIRIRKIDNTTNYLK
jgi:hypothetical protein